MNEWVRGYVHVRIYTGVSVRVRERACLETLEVTSDEF